MQLRWIIIPVFLLTTATAGCRSAGPGAQHPEQTVSNDDLREAALRFALQKTKSNRAVFIAWGGYDNGWHDPPKGFIQRFDDLDIQVRPASQARLPKFDNPQPDNQKPNDKLPDVEDPVTGKPANIYWVAKPQWPARDRVRIDFGIYGGPGLGGDLQINLKRYGNIWIIEPQPDKPTGPAN